MTGHNPNEVPRNETPKVDEVRAQLVANKNEAYRLLRDGGVNALAVINAVLEELPPADPNQYRLRELRNTLADQTFADALSDWADRAAQNMVPEPGPEQIERMIYLTSNLDEAIQDSATAQLAIAVGAEVIDLANTMLAA